MPLTAGSRFGAYEVVATIGRGGMGEVFRAHDSKLGRDVALKVLPGHLVTDPERRARFEREARLLASLNTWRGAAGQSDVPAWQIDDLLATLATIRPVTTLARAERDAAEYGFGDAATAVRLDAGTEVALELEVGDRNPAWTGVYVRRTGSPDAHLMGALLHWELEKLHDSVTQ